MDAEIKNKVLLIQNDLETAKEILSWLQETSDVKHIVFESDAPEAIQAEHWDLVITDSTSTVHNDVEITKFVKSIDPVTPVIIVTQHQKINFILQALEGHADALLFKPLNKTEFMETVTRLVAESHTKHHLSKKIILAISAHPDDVEIGCGGTLAQHHENGDEIHILTLTQGEVGGDPNIRKLESKNAAAVQSANLHMTKLADTKIQEGIETIKVIEELVSVIKPTHIYTHSEHDTHKDHRNVHLATLSACRQIKNIYCYQSPSTTTYFRPTLFIEITEASLNKKLEAIACFESQCAIRPYLKPDMIRATARYWGRFNNYTLAEPMEIIRQRILFS